MSGDFDLSRFERLLHEARVLGRPAICIDVNEAFALVRRARDALEDSARLRKERDVAIALLCMPRDALEKKR